MSSPAPPPAVTQQTSKVELPAWVDQGGQENYQLAKDVAAQPFVAYGGERVAGLTPAEAAAPGMVQQGQATTNAALGTALGAAQGVQGYQPPRVQGPNGFGAVQAGSFLNQNIGAYMDPNIQSVIDPAIADATRQAARADQTATDQARGVGAWGGSRFGVENAVRAAETTRNIGQLSANLRSQAFESAAGRAGADTQSALQAALANQSAGLTSTGQRIQAESTNASNAIAAQQLALQGGALANTVGQTASDTAGRNAVLTAGFGATERGINQQGLDVNYQNFTAQQGEAEKDLNLRLAALGMTPYGKTTSGTTTQTTPTTTNPWMTGIGAAATVLPLMFSDRSVKKNIKKIGKVPGTDLNAYKFQYKKGMTGGVETPPTVGLMADDVKVKVPGAVHKTVVNGQKVDAVDYGHAIMGSRRPRDDKGIPRGKYAPRGIGIGSKFKLRAA
jgi:hypothetical protein